MRRYLVQVLQGDIAAGYRDSCSGCPIALAVHRALGWPVTVGKEDLFEYNEADDESDGLGPGRRIAELPPRAVKFIRDFDARRPVRPFGFYIWIRNRDVHKGRPAGMEMVLSG